MNPVTHYLLSWTVAEVSPLEERDKSLVAWSGALPDMDGLGVAIDWCNRLLGGETTSFYLQYHHQLLHGIFGALLLAGLTLFFSTKKTLTFFLTFIVVHIHILCDLLGSRGKMLEDIWPIPYLAPFSQQGELFWSYQWPLNGWQNMLITTILIIFMFYRTIKYGHSALRPINLVVHQAFVETVQKRWKKLSKQ